jgi:hypothetical protein
MMRIVAGVECTWTPAFGREEEAQEVIATAPDMNLGRWGIHPMRRKRIVVVF